MMLREEDTSPSLHSDRLLYIGSASFLVLKTRLRPTRPPSICRCVNRRKQTSRAGDEHFFPVRLPDVRNSLSNGRLVFIAFLVSLSPPVSSHALNIASSSPFNVVDHNNGSRATTRT